MSELAAEIPEDCPESGLRRLRNVERAAFPETLKEIIRRADLRFTFAIAGIRAAAMNLKRLITLELILTTAWSFYGVANICKGTSIRNLAGLALFFSSLTDIFAIRLWSVLKQHLELLAIPHP